MSLGRLQINAECERYVLCHAAGQAGVAINPARTMVLRGVTRPGVLVEENELASATVPADVFCLHWTGLSVDSAHGALPLATMVCEIRYATDGDSGNGGMDRGRLLSAMDGELVATVSAAAAERTMKMNYVSAAGGSGLAPVAMTTNVFWSDVDVCEQWW